MRDRALRERVEGVTASAPILARWALRPLASSPVGEDGLRSASFQKRRSSEVIVALARRDNEVDGPGQAVAGHVDLGGQSASGTPHSQIEPPFWSRCPGLASPAG